MVSAQRRASTIWRRSRDCISDADYAKWHVAGRDVPSSRMGSLGGAGLKPCHVCQVSCRAAADHYSVASYSCSWKPEIDRLTSVYVTWRRLLMILRYCRDQRTYRSEDRGETWTVVDSLTWPEHHAGSAGPALCELNDNYQTIVATCWKIDFDDKEYPLQFTTSSTAGQSFSAPAASTGDNLPAVHSIQNISECRQQRWCGK